MPCASGACAHAAARICYVRTPVFNASYSKRTLSIINGLYLAPPAAARGTEREREREREINQTEKNLVQLLTHVTHFCLFGFKAQHVQPMLRVLRRHHVHVHLVRSFHSISSEHTKSLAL